MYLENIKGPQDVKNLRKEELQVLANEMRTALLQKLSRHGGHIGPNLGMVEATLLCTMYLTPRWIKWYLMYRIRAIAISC